MDHWKEDGFFGYQCLNGSNPRMIQRCKKLPENFPVVPDMVQSSMAPRTNLDKELKVKKYCRYTNDCDATNTADCLFIHLVLSAPFMSTFFLMFYLTRQVISTCRTMPSWTGFPPTQSGANLSSSLLLSVSCTNTRMTDSYLLLYRYIIYTRHAPVQKFGTRHVTDVHAHNHTGLCSMKLDEHL